MAFYNCTVCSTADGEILVAECGRQCTGGGGGCRSLVMCGCGDIDGGGGGGGGRRRSNSVGALTQCRRRRRRRQLTRARL